MKKTQVLFLDALKHSLKNEKTDWQDDISITEWQEIFHLAIIHEVLPLIMETVYENKSLQSYEGMRDTMINQSRMITISQAKRTAEFIILYQNMLENNLKPLVMKGIICRNLYPNPAQRPSLDEDLLIFSYQIDQYHSFLLKNGFHLVDKDTDIHKADEVSYKNNDTHLYLELHKYLFPLNAAAYGDLNSLFSVLDEKKTETIHQTNIRTFGATDHLLYMICHAYKHFLYSGIGIRQICDIALYCKAFDQELDWDKIYESCRLFRIDQFLKAVIKICEIYLGLDPLSCSCSKVWNVNDIDEKPLLEDILSGGLYGTADENRIHSSTMTLEVVSAQKQGRKPRSLMKSLFPPISYMQRRYSYVNDNKILLPFAWIQRGIEYYHRQTAKKTNPAKTIEIGNGRIGLMRKYGIID